MFSSIVAAAVDYNTSYNLDSSAGSGTSAGIGIGLILVYLVLALVMLVSLWKVYAKAGKPGWASIVPIYNTWVMLEIAGKPTWWFLLLLIPFVNIVVLVLVTIELAKRFGKGGGFAVLLILLPFIGYPILAFSKAEYHAQDDSLAGQTGTPAVAAPAPASAEIAAPSVVPAPTTPIAPAPPVVPSQDVTTPPAPNVVSPTPAPQQNDQPPAAPQQ